MSTVEVSAARGYYGVCAKFRAVCAGWVGGSSVLSLPSRRARLSSLGATLTMRDVSAPRTNVGSSPRMRKWATLAKKRVYFVRPKTAKHIVKERAKNTNIKGIAVTVSIAKM